MSNNHLETAQQIVIQLAQGDFVGAWQQMESTIRERFSAEQLRAGWQGVEAQMGPFKKQFTYIYSLDGTVTPEHQQHLDEVKKQVAQVKAPDLSPETLAATLPFGIPAAYWLTLRGYHPEAVARTLPHPLLILQGESDYQVTMEDFQLWKDALADRKDAQFKSYPALSHLFMLIEGGGKATPTTYAIAGHVAEEVVQDIASWIKLHAK